MFFNINNNNNKFVLQDFVFFNMASKDTVGAEPFKKWSFTRDFEIKEEGGFVVEALCKYCFVVYFDAFEGEVSRQKYVGSVRRPCYQYLEPVHHIHNKTLKRHVGDANLFHSWCKLKQSSSNRKPSSNRKLATIKG